MVFNFLSIQVRVLCNQAGVWKNSKLDRITWHLLLSSLILNPFLYTFSRKQCRDSLWQVLCCCFISRRRADENAVRWSQGAQRPVLCCPVLLGRHRNESFASSRQGRKKPRTLTILSDDQSHQCMALNGFVLPNKDNCDAGSISSTSFTLKKCHVELNSDCLDQIEDQGVINPVLDCNAGSIYQIEEKEECSSD